MPEHLIQLRRAWVEHREASEPRRLDLPLPSAPDRRMRISRAFRCPPIDPATESLRLRLENVPGLKLARLNGQVILHEPAEANPLELALPPDLPTRNLLELEVDLPTEGPLTPWGRIALVVQS